LGIVELFEFHSLFHKLHKFLSINSAAQSWFGLLKILEHSLYTLSKRVLNMRFNFLSMGDEALTLAQCTGQFLQGIAI